MFVLMFVCVLLFSVDVCMCVCVCVGGWVFAQYGLKLCNLTLP